jgi:fumarylacetoacetase
MIDHTHDPHLKSWVESANEPETAFPIQNLPYATFLKGHALFKRVGAAIGNRVLDLTETFGIDTLESIMQMPKQDRIHLRHRISDYLSQHKQGRDQFLTPISEVDLLVPCRIGDYTDFYASIDHATNVGRLFRPDNPLLPNYKWVPIAYHGRTSTIVVSGTQIRRPKGQTVDNPAGPPTYAPTKRLDYELEIGAFLGPGNKPGDPIPIEEAEDHLFGVCLLNDWSARDIQAWEYQPLGPFLAKNFATSISPWVITREALAPFRCALPPRPAGDPQPLPHLHATEGAYRITLEAWLNSTRISQSDFSTLYWTLGQMIAHHTSNGCAIRPGDLIGSGTVSGPEKFNRGCLLEMGAKFLDDGDEVVLRGWCEQPGYRRIGLGECRGTIAPA